MSSQNKAQVKSIKNEREYRRILGEIESLMGARAGSEEAKELDALMTLAVAWEKKHGQTRQPK